MSLVMAPVFYRALAAELDRNTRMPELLAGLTGCLAAMMQDTIDFVPIDKRDEALAIMQEAMFGAVAAGDNVTKQ
jgi:hypothetical protein